MRASRYLAAMLLAALAACSAGTKRRPPRPPAGARQLHLGARAVLGSRGMGHREHVMSLSFAPDGASLASTSIARRMAVWAIPGGKRRRLAAQRGTAAVFSPDGRVLATADGELVRLWSVATGKPLRSFALEADRVVFSRDGKLLAARSRRYVPPAPTTRRTATKGQRGVPDAFRRRRSMGSFRALAVVLELASGKRLHALDCGRTDSLRTLFIAFGPRGRSLLTLGEDHLYRVWDLARGTVRSSKNTKDDGIDLLAASPDGKTLVGRRAESFVAFASDTLTAREILLPNAEEVTAAAFSADGAVLAANGKGVRLWRRGKKGALGGKQRLRASAEVVALSADGRTLATGNAAGAIRLWDTRATPPRSLDPPGHAFAVTAVAISGDGKLMASGDARGRVLLWDPRRARLLRRLESCAGQGEVAALAFSPDSKLLAAGRDDTTAGQALCLYAVPGGKLRFGREASAEEDDDDAGMPFGPDPGDMDDDEAGLAGQPALGRLAERVHGLAFTPDGKTLATAHGRSALSLWDVASGALRQRLSYRNSVFPLHAVAFAPGGRLLAAGTAEGTVALWRRKTSVSLKKLAARASWDAKPFKVLRGHAKAAVRAVAFAPKGALLAAAGADRSIRLWRLPRGEQLRRWDGHEGTVNQIAFSPDGRALASAGEDGTVQLWECLARKQRRLWSARERAAPAWFLEVALGRRLAIFDGHRGAVKALAFAPDGRTLASGGADTTVQLWRAR